jgi:hypothetical protein
VGDLLLPEITPGGSRSGAYHNKTAGIIMHCNFYAFFMSRGSLSVQQNAHSGHLRTAPDGSGQEYHQDSCGFLLLERTISRRLIVEGVRPNQLYYRKLVSVERMGWKADRRQGRGPPCGRGAPGLTCSDALAIDRTAPARKYTNVRSA